MGKSDGIPHRTFQVIVISVVLGTLLGTTVAIADDMASSTSDTASSTAIFLDASSTAATSTDSAAVLQNVATSRPDSATSSATTTQATTTAILSNTSTSTLTDMRLTSTATTTRTTKKVQVTCSMAYTADLYDTPSGHLDPTYKLASSAGEVGALVAHIIGTQSWTVCHDSLGREFELKMPAQEYANLSHSDALIPSQDIDMPN